MTFYGAKAVTIGIDWKTGISAKDWESVARKEKIEGVELELVKLEGIVQAIHENLEYLKDREAVMREENEKTNARVAWLSIMSLGICIAAAVLLRGLKNELEDLKATVKKNEAWKREKEALHSVKNELEKRVIQMMSKVNELEKKLEEKETLITERGVDNNVNGISAEDKVKVPGGNVDLLMAAASSVAAVALVGILCFLRFARKS